MKKIRSPKVATKTKQAILSFCFLFLISAVSFVIVPEAAESRTPIVSPALRVLAEENSMAMAGLKGSEIEFDHDDFARAMNLSKVSQITITKAPPVTDGELRLGSTVITGGQTISSSNLSLLSYVAGNADITTSSFRFSVGDSPVEITCNLYLLDRVNQSPTLDSVPKTSLNVSTHRNITLYGTLPCYDPDGDETQIEIVSYPETGLLILTDRATGDYTFTPGEGYSGKDSFTYVARDVYGNYSAAATVSLTVTKPKTSVVYADMLDSPEYNAALSATEAGLMSGTQVGGVTYFYPDRTVSRGEFIVMAMNALGINEVSAGSKTVFADDGQIPRDMKGYIATAYELGYIKGETDENGQLCFCPNRAVTRAEAAVMIGNMIDAATPTVTPTFSDAEEIPAWAASSIHSLHSMGIMTATDGSISALDAVTRADAAEILCALIIATE